MDKDVLTFIFQEYSQMLFLYALSLTKHKEDAEDLVSETFVKALLSFEGKDQEIKNWLYRVLKNLYIDQYRKRKKQNIANQYSIDWIVDQYHAMEYYIKEENKRWLYTNICMLQANEKDILLIDLLWKMKDKEISELLGITIDNVRTIRYRSKQKLKKKAIQEGVYYE